MRRISFSVAASSLSSPLALSLILILLAPLMLARHGQRRIFNHAVMPEPRYRWHIGRMGILPVLQNEWLKRHQTFVAESRTHPIDLLFVGDSITEAWAGPGKAVWNKHYAGRNAANFGISGDRTENLLWRLENGELQGVQPKVAIVLIGTNNLGREPADSPDEIAAGIAAVVRKLKNHSATTKVLLLGLFPRADLAESTLNRRVADVNRLIERLADGRRVFFLNFGEAFLDADGSPSPGILPDLLHPNTKGYEIWAEALDAKLAGMLDADWAGQTHGVLSSNGTGLRTR